ncbi:MAG: hypothetical protein GY795_31190 [Desulfobacterales bacterium]|nr:hypothetical protein [Desulfobacterales bacterium]
MAEEIFEPGLSDIITEDDTPVANFFVEKQQRLLAGSLNSSWKPGRPFIAFANVGIFYDLKQPPLVPNMFLSMDVKLPEDVWKKENRAYFLFKYGKPPEVVVEIVTDPEDGIRFQDYVQQG